MQQEQRLTVKKLTWHFGNFLLSLLGMEGDEMWVASCIQKGHQQQVKLPEFWSPCPTPDKAVPMLRKLVNHDARRPWDQISHGAFLVHNCLLISIQMTLAMVCFKKKKKTKCLNFEKNLVICNDEHSCGHTCVPWLVCFCVMYIGQGSQFSFSYSTMLVLGIELRSLSMAASVFVCWAILPSHREQS